MYAIPVCVVTTQHSLLVRHLTLEQTNNTCKFGTLKRCKRQLLVYTSSAVYCIRLRLPCDAIMDMDSKTSLEIRTSVGLFQTWFTTTYSTMVSWLHTLWAKLLAIILMLNAILCWWQS